MYSATSSGQTTGSGVSDGNETLQTLSSLIQKKKVLAGCGLASGNVWCSQIIARSGFDWVLIDMEHAPICPEKATAITQAVVAASAGQCIPIIRTPSHGVEWVKWALDCGAAGIIVPMINNGAEAERVVQHALYPPHGQRSFGPFLAPFADTDRTSDVAKYLTKRVPQLAIILMIESAEGVRHAEEILSVKGVTGCFVGSFDLRQSLGLQGGDGEEPVFVEALEKVLSIGRRLNLAVGTVAMSEAAAKRKTEMGFSFLLSGTDMFFLAAGAERNLDQCVRGVRSAEV
ncbi:hypothetical protein AYO21_08581 [Fonsecaea monophora]|uniref:HpcH/HpaI aldolase/citrate lyase domain-containing protein n=1 Tax=Fonsecaea monophora TaxID=254056 RepID=A0A177EYN1_9EURO|nr:hypothetical protein AYO21_08581 [Fonsecaea monophora]KAH0836218.1 4-hydroxy-2-oxo-heptane-1,7-dioate aldolase [Fonsecaea pedrosoi]OAG37163.1 hypothetical protein AYO21_08581 [Fonsecaea monophora]